MKIPEHALSTYRLYSGKKTGVTIAIARPHCREVDKAVKAGCNPTGQPRRKCKARGKTFQTRYAYRACREGAKEQISAMAINGSGIRDTARVARELGISQVAVMKTIKKKPPR